MDPTRGRDIGRESAEAGSSWSHALPPVGAVPMDLTDVYGHLEDKGLQYGPAFQGLRGAWRSAAQMWARIELPETLTDAEAYGLHPALLDASLHGVALLTTLESSDDTLYLPFALDRFSLWRSRIHRGLGSNRSGSEEAQSVRTTFVLFDDGGEPLGEGVGVQLKAPIPRPCNGPKVVD